MALTRNVIFIAFVLLVLVSITTQKKNQRQCIKARCNRLLKNFKKLSCEPETPVDGEWNEWTESSACSVTCGGGNKNSSRECIIQPQNGGTPCEGGKVKTESCGNQKCPVDGEWNEWTESSACSVTCGGGNKNSSRECIIQPQNGGTPCKGDAVKTEICGNQKCPVDGVWKEWTESSACSVTCGGGNKTYSRECIQPQNRGTPCKGIAEKTEICGKQECPGPWKLCDNPVPVVKKEKIPWNPDSQTITVTANSEAGSEDEVDVLFFDTAGELGYVTIYFGTETEYRIGRCIPVYTPFTAAIPAMTKKTWTITYNFAEQRLVLHCNGVQVLTVVLSEWCYDSGWGDFWGRKPTQMQFGMDGLFGITDTASDTYCFSSNPGAI